MSIQFAKKLAQLPRYEGGMDLPSPDIEAKLHLDLVLNSGFALR